MRLGLKEWMVCRWRLSRGLRDGGVSYLEKTLKGQLTAFLLKVADRLVHFFFVPSVSRSTSMDHVRVLVSHSELVTVVLFQMLSSNALA